MEAQSGTTPVVVEGTRRKRGPNRAHRAQALEAKIDRDRNAEMAKHYDALRDLIPEAVEFTRALLTDRVYRMVEAIDPTTGKTRMKRERDYVSLELRDKVRQDVLDRGGMPKKSEQDIALVGQNAGILLKVDGGLGWPAMPEGSGERDAQPAPGADGAGGMGGDSQLAH